MIKFKEGYKYQLGEDYYFVFNIKDQSFKLARTTTKDFYQVHCIPCTEGGYRVCIQAKKGYCWDGCTGIRDTEKNMEAGLKHDMLYQATREGVFPHWFYKQADDIFRDTCIEKGTAKWMARIYHKVLSLMKGKYAKAKNGKKVIVIL